MQSKTSHTSVRCDMKEPGCFTIVKVSLKKAANFLTARDRNLPFEPTEFEVKNRFTLLGLFINQEQYHFPLMSKRPPSFFVFI